MYNFRTAKPSYLTKFPRFPKLPPEVQDKVWEHAFPGSRPILLRRVPNIVDKEKQLAKGVPEWETNDLMWVRAARIPTVLHVCRNSRAVALKSYTLTFEWCLEGKPIYVDWNKDIIFFTDDWTIRDFAVEACPPPHANWTGVTNREQHAKDQRQRELLEMFEKLKFVYIKDPSVNNIVQFKVLDTLYCDDKLAVENRFGALDDPNFDVRWTNMEERNKDIALAQLYRPWNVSAKYPVGEMGSQPFNRRFITAVNMMRQWEHVVEVQIWQQHPGESYFWSDCPEVISDCYTEAEERKEKRYYADKPEKYAEHLAGQEYYRKLSTNPCGVFKPSGGEWTGRLQKGKKEIEEV